MNDPALVDKYEDDLFKLFAEMSQHLSTDVIDDLIKQVSIQLGVMEFAKEWLGKHGNPSDIASDAPQ